MTDDLNGSRHDRSVRRRYLTRGTILITVLCAYWATIFIGTHIPTIPQELADRGDKLLHFTAYCGLAAVLLLWQTRWKRLSPVSVGVLWLLVAGYGIFDELTQPLVGRDCELGDWLADIAGAAAGLLITWPVAAWYFRDRWPKPVEPPKPLGGRV